MDSDDEYEVQERPAKRFKHQSYKQSLKDVHLPSAFVQTKFDHDLPDDASHFHEALEHWRQLNLSPSFIKFANGADGLSASMPSLLHHWKDVVDLWIEALEGSDDNGLVALLDLLQKLTHDLRSTLCPVYKSILTRLLKLLPKAIPAEALTSLLSTLSSIFRHLLLPLTSQDAQNAPAEVKDMQDVLLETWDMVRDSLAKCNPDVQKAAAEVWGGVLRRMRGSVRERSVWLMLGAEGKGMEGIEDSCAWIIVFACKSVSQTLHTSAPSIVTSLLTFHLSSHEQDAERTYTLIRRVLTALIHHVKNADQFESIAGFVVGRFCEVFAGDGIDDEEMERKRRICEVVAVLVSVRGGSRVAAKYLATIFTTLPSIPLRQALQPSLLKLTTSSLLASDLSLSLGPGRKVLEHAWTVPSFGLRLSGALAEIQWGGLKLVGLPIILKNLEKMLEEEPVAMLRLLKELSAGKVLGSGDWEGKVDRWVLERLGGWEKSEASVAELSDILCLSPHLPSVPTSLVTIIDTSLSADDPEEDYKETYANNAWVTGACMRCLAERSEMGWVGKVHLMGWVGKVLEKWSWSDSVLGGLVALLDASSSLGLHQLSPLSAAYTSLQTCLQSHSRNLRLNALRLLTSPITQLSSTTSDIIKRCLGAEEVALDVQSVRERIVKTKRLAPAVSGESEADVCVKWLIAQLKVNLRPLWAPVIETLHALSQRYGDIVWTHLFRELQSLEALGGKAPMPEWMKRSAGDDEDGGISEEEKTWRDPSAHKMRIVTYRWLQRDVARVHIREAQLSNDRLDLANYESQLLLALGECSSVAEKHNRELIPFFLSLSAPEPPSKLPRHKLSEWLTLFSKFSNPKALTSTDDLHNLYIILLSHPDRALQKLALSCLLTYESPHLQPHETTLEALLDDARWREQLTSLDISAIEQQDRAELVDVLTRLLFGLMLEKRGRSRGADRRSAILTAFGGCSDEELGLLVDLMLGPFAETEVQRSSPFDVVPVKEGITSAQQVGFLTLLGDVLRNLGSRLVQRWPSLVGTTIGLLAHAQERIDSKSQGGEDGEEVEEEEAPVEGDSPSRSIRIVRQLGMKRFADFFRQPIPFDFHPYMTAAFRTFISPRLPLFESENIQSPSTLLELFHTWTLRQEFVPILVDYDSRVIPKIYACLVAANVKPAVVARIFDILEHLLSFASTDKAIFESVLRPHISLLLTNLSSLVEKGQGVTSVATPLGQRQIGILSEIAPYLTDPVQASKLLALFVPILRKPWKLVNEKIKLNLLKILESIFPLVSELRDPSSTTYTKTCDALALLFQTLRGRPARLALVSTVHKLATIDPSLQTLADLLESLNAFSAKRMEQPDFERRLDAFAELNDKLHDSLLPIQWTFVLYDTLHCIQDPDELAVRNSAASAMKRFIDKVAEQPTSEYERIFIRTLFPALKKGLRAKHDMVRAEILSVIAYAISMCDRLESLREMRVLLAGGDEEANFFNNILHVQVHRRTRALRRLAEYVDEGHIRSGTLAEVLIPLVSNFIASTTSVDHLLVNEAINTTGRMAKHLKWGAYHGLVQQYLRLCQKKDESEKVYVRTLVSLLDSFHFPMDEVVVDVEKSDAPADEEATDEPVATSIPTLGPDLARIEDAVNNRLLPSLLRHLEKRDEIEDSMRIPIAVGVVQIAKHLPEKARQSYISRLLTIVSQILRSKSQDTRDLVKETLCRMTVILGPRYLPSILQEMRSALQRGPQLHVLAFSVHSILTHITQPEYVATFDNLDGCVDHISHISAEVIFGQSGKDVQSEDFKTTLREVRSSTSKGLDSFTILAKFITPSKISNLLSPIRAVMHETESLKVMQQVEEVLHRVAGGLNANKHLTPPELVALCHTLISQNSRFVQERPRPSKERKGKGASEMKRKVPSDTGHYANNSFRFIAFGLELFITAFRRSRFDFQNPKVIAQLEPMVAVIGNTLYSTNGQAISLGLRASASIVKCPLKSVDKSLPVFVRRTIEIIKEAGNTSSDIVQTAFKSLATILRDCSSAQVKEQDLVYLLELISPDLEEPTRQASVFSILRAIVARKFVVPEIYDIMDKISEILVTSQSPQVQELCRVVLLQFLLDYPQGKGRLRNHMTFLAKNLSYVHESGRQSVMELLGAVVAKFEVSIIREYADLLFVALVMVLANDESSKCREMASELIKNLIARVDIDHRRLLVSHLHSWSSQASQPQLTKVSSQVYGLLIDVLQQDSLPYLPTAIEDFNAGLQRSAITLEDLGQDDDVDQTDVELDWQTPYHILTGFGKLVQTFPNLTKDAGKISWPAAVAHLLYPHSWVRTASCRLIGVLYSTVAVTVPDEDGSAESPLSRKGMEEVAKKLCTQLKSPHLDAPLSLQVVKNLFYIGKCFTLIPFPTAVQRGPQVDHPGDVSDDDSDEEAGNEAGPSTNLKVRHPIPWLFSNLSYQARSAHIMRRNKSRSSDNWYHQPAAVLRWFAAMTTFMDANLLQKYLVHILSPLYRISEDDTIRDPHMDELKTLAIELQDLVQAKVGTTVFATTYNQIRQKVIGVQRERKVARATRVTVNPQAAAKRKLQRNVSKKESRKRRSEAFADDKGRLPSTKKRRQE